MNQWHCVIHGTECGPFTDAQLRQLAASGELRPGDKVWKEGLADWVPASQIKALFPPAAPAPPPLPPPPLPAPIAKRPPGAASGTLKVFVKSPLKDIGRGTFQCQLAPRGITLTQKKRAPVVIPVGTAIDYLKGNSFIARLPRTTVNVRIVTYTKYGERLTRDLVAFLRGQSGAPVLSDYALEWYFAVPVFLPLLGLVMWFGAIAWGINLCVVGLITFIVQRETLNRWLRLALAYGAATAFLLALLVVNVFAFVNAVPKATPGSFGVPSNPRLRVAAPTPGNPPPAPLARDPSPRPPAAPATSTPTAAELDAKLAQIPAFWQPAAGTPDDILPSMTVRRRQTTAGNLVLQTGDRLTSSKSYAPPVSFRIIALTDSTNIRLAHAADQVIFNWEMRPDELRVDGGPANGTHKPGAGRVPVNQWVAIEWVVLPDQMILYVDGQERYRHRADFSNIDKPLTIFPMGSTLRIHSVTVARP